MGRPEQRLSDALRRALRAEGWFTAKSHGNLYQAGWPDLLCYHRVHGYRWVETKTERGRLTPAQFETFTAWTGAGISIWVLTEPRLDRLFEPPNVWVWLDRYKSKGRARIKTYFRT